MSRAEFDGNVHVEISLQAIELSAQSVNFSENHVHLRAYFCAHGIVHASLLSNKRGEHRRQLRRGEAFQQSAHSNFTEEKLIGPTDAGGHSAQSCRAVGIELTLQTQD